jgi:ubiquinone/menaquinone biosynthesis C-methylase UbiE
MQAPMSSTSFRMMSMMLGIRNVFLRPRKVLRDACLSSGDRVLDFGSGPGDYALAAAELVGPGGKVYALDIHPMAATRIVQRARALGLENVVPITSSCQTDLEDESIDVVLLYYTLHLVEEKEAVLKELHRVLKPGGRLSFATRLESRARVLQRITGGRLFALVRREKETYAFIKATTEPVPSEAASQANAARA